MVRASKIATNFSVFDSYRTFHKNPIQRHGDGMSAFDALAGGALEPLTLELVEKDGGEIFGVQIAAEDDGRLGRITLQIRQDFVQLLRLNVAHASTLEMHVVHEQQMTRQFKLGYQSDAASESPLHERQEEGIQLWGFQKPD